MLRNKDVLVGESVVVNLGDTRMRRVKYYIKDDALVWVLLELGTDSQFVNISCRSFFDGLAFCFYLTVMVVMTGAPSSLSA